MLSQQQIRDSAPLFKTVTDAEAAQIASLVLDNLQYQTNLATTLAALQFSDPGTRQALADTIQSFVYRLLQSRSAANVVEVLQEFGLPEEHAASVGGVIGERIDDIAKDFASKSSGERLVDLEWRFGLTVASSSGASPPFVQMRISFENQPPVSVEMDMRQFFEFASDVKRIQNQQSNNLRL